MLNRPIVSRICLLALLIVNFGVLAHAQGIGLSPAIINQKFKPGQTFTTTLSLLNSGPNAVVLKTMTSDMWFDPVTNERTLLPLGTHPRSASNWVEFVPNHLVVEPNQTAQVKLVVTPRKDASGGYYSVLFFESRPELTANDKGQSVYANFRIGALLLLTAEGTEQYNVSISDYNVTPPDASHKLQAQFVVDNQSNTHVMPRVQLVVLDDKKLFIGKTEGDQKRFMPGQKNVYKIKYPGELAPGDYSAVLTIVHEGGQVVTREIPFNVAKNQE